MGWNRPLRWGLPTLTASAALLAAPSVALAESMPYPGDLGQAMAALLIFLLLVVVLGKWAWRPVVAQLRHREEDLAETLEEARKREAKADEIMAEYQEQIDNIEAEADRILAAARRKADSQREEVVAEAREEARQAIQRATEEIASARREALRSLQAETADLAADLAEQFLREKLTQDDHAFLVDAAAEQVSRKAGAES